MLMSIHRATPSLRCMWMVAIRVHNGYYTAAAAACSLLLLLPEAAAAAAWGAGGLYCGAQRQQSCTALGSVGMSLLERGVACALPWPGHPIFEPCLLACPA